MTSVSGCTAEKRSSTAQKAVEVQVPRLLLFVKSFGFTDFVDV
jgi:hypothetical protein